MRYFFFTYRGDSGGKYSHGNLWIARENFPSNEELKELVQPDNPRLDIVITGWNEFNSEEDFISFSGLNN